MLYLRTFGGLSLENGGSSLAGAGTQRSRLALLAVLAAAGDRGISRDRLLAIFWPESDKERAGGALKQALYALRRDLGAPELVSGNGHLVLNPAVINSDLGEFTHALEGSDWERAVALYRGMFLEGVHLNGGEFDRWLEPQRRHLHERYQEALGRLARNAEGRSEYSEAVRWRRALAAADPFSAIAACSLMRALVGMGDSASALRHARIYQQLLQSDLDAPADRSVLDLAAEISRRAATSGTAEGAAASVVEPEPLTSRVAPEASSGMVRSRNRWAPGLALVALGGVIGVLAIRDGRQHLDPDRVVMFAGNGSATVPALDSMLLAGLTEGLVGRDRALKLSLATPNSHAPVETARAANARYVVRVASAAEGDSVRFVASVTDAVSETVLGTIEPVVVLAAASADGARALCDRIAVALAGRRNPLFANWAYAAALPASWESFELLGLGIQAFAGGGATEARTYFRAAAALDPSSGSPLLWEALVVQGSGARSESDSILALAEQPARRLGRWERGLAAVLRARNQHDLPAAHAAGHRLLEVVPGSEWGLLMARDALRLGRAREAAELSEAVSRNPGWTKDWWLAVMTREQAYHSLGDYRRELAVVRDALRRDPDSRLWLQSEVKALAGLDRVPEVVASCERAVSLRPERDIVEWWPCEQALLELAAHGHMDAARSLAQRLLPAREKETAGIPMHGALARAVTFATLADWENAGGALPAVPSSEHGNREYLELLSLVQAFQGDRAGVEQTLLRIDTLTARGGEPLAGSDTYHRAGVAALLGDRDHAIDLIEQAFREGFGRIPLHWAGPFDGLRGDARFDALARPVEDADHLTRIHGLLLTAR